MFKTSLVFALATAAMGQTGSPGAGERQIMAGSGTLRSGVVAFRSVLSPAGASSEGLGAGGILTDANSNTVHRYMVDSKDGLLLGYDLTVGQQDPAGLHLVSFRPLSQIEQLHDVPPGLKFMVLPQYPAPQTVREGDTIALDLMVSADRTQKLTDYLRILSQEPPPAKTNTTPRDFTLDDGPVVFDTTRLTFWQQGQEYTGRSGFTGKPGATLWIAIPGQGRYILSLAPHPGFTKSGTIRDNVVSFADADRQYELRFQSPIAGTGKAWNLYVLHDRDWKPDSLHAGSVGMGTDRLDNLTASH